jgi:hypothetical protein
MTKPKAMTEQEAAQLLAEKSGFMVSEILRSEPSYSAASRIARATVVNNPQLYLRVKDAILLLGVHHELAKGKHSRKHI